MLFEISRASDTVSCYRRGRNYPPTQAQDLANKLAELSSVVFVTIAIY